MNNKIIKTDIEKILFFDIETVRRNKELDLNSKEFDLYSLSLRDKTTGFVPPAIEVIKHYENNGALKPEFNKIVVISIGFVKGTTLYYKALVGEQKDIIKQFYDVVSSTGFTVCGHNIIGFDLPTVRIKCFEEGMDLEIIPDGINDCDKKPWDLAKKVLDTMELIKGTYFYNMSLDSACMLKGIESSKDDISGPYVSQVYYNEGVRRIATYCNKDVIATAKLFCSLQGKDGFLTEFLDRGEQELKEKEPINVLDNILASGQLNKKSIEAIVEFTEKENLDKKDVLTLVKAALSKSKEYQKISEEDYIELEEALGISVDYSLIEPVTTKKNLGKVEANKLIQMYKKASKEVKEEVISLTEQYLDTNSKSEQKRTKKAFEYLREQLGNLTKTDKK